MTDSGLPGSILYLEDDDNDAFLMQHAFRRLAVRHPLVIVRDGRQTMDYLRGEQPFSDRRVHPFPVLMLLDLNLPLLTGFEVLQWIRANAQFAHLRVAILSSSNHKKDMDRAYALGANAYFVKPADVARRLELVTTLRDQWIG